MTILHRFVSIIARILRGGRAERQLDDELQSYIDASTADRVRDGMPPQEARRLAILELGGVEQAKEKVRTYRHGALLDELLRDFRHALRLLANNPGFAATVVLVLALGIGANTAIFGVMNAVMLKSLPVRDPSRLVEIRIGARRDTFSNPVWEQIRSRQELFDGSIAYSVRRYDLASGGETRLVDGVQVSGSYFDVLGVRPVIGRLFTEADDARGCGADGPTAVISYGFWKSHYGSRSDVVGKQITLNGQPFTVIGVTPPQFFGVRVGQSFQIATPLCASDYLQERNRFWLRMMGRLKPGERMQETERRLRAVQGAIREATLPFDASGARSLSKGYLAEPFRLLPAAAGSSSVRVQYARALFVLMTIAGLVLLVTCGNVASLLLARATARTREIAIRASIGASRARLVRQLLMESVVLSLCGAAVGILGAPAASRFLVYRLSTANARVYLDLSLDRRVLGFTLVAGIATGLLFGIIPAMRSTRLGAAEALRIMGANPAAFRNRTRAARWLVSFQMGLSLALMFAAALFLRSYRQIVTADHGFNWTQVLLIDIGSTGVGDMGVSGRLPQSDAGTLYSQILDSVRAAPGVKSAAYSFMTPVGDSAFYTNVRVDGYEPQSDPDISVSLNVISPGYFETFGTRLLAGRDFDNHDAPGAEDIVIVNEAFARKFMSGANPVGRTVRLVAPGDRWLPAQVIGLVGDAKYLSLTESVPPTIYELVSPKLSPGWFISVKTAGNPVAAAPSIVTAIEKVNKNIPLTVHTFQSQIEDSLIQERLMAILSAFFGALALIIAAVGLAGLVSYTVSRRSAEIGIRAALGATSGSLVSLMMRDVAFMTAAGLVSGVVCGLAGSRMLETMLYGIRRDDIASIAIAAATLVIVAALSGYIPARRAARIDPIQCLRSQ